MRIRRWCRGSFHTSRFARTSGHEQRARLHANGDVCSVPKGGHWVRAQRKGEHTLNYGDLHSSSEPGSTKQRLFAETLPALLCWRGVLVTEVVEHKGHQQIQANVFSRFNNDVFLIPRQCLWVLMLSQLPDINIRLRMRGRYAYGMRRHHHQPTKTTTAAAQGNSHEDTTTNNINQQRCDMYTPQKEEHTEYGRAPSVHSIPRSEYVNSSRSSCSRRCNCSRRDCAMDSTVSRSWRMLLINLSSCASQLATT